MLQQSPWKLRLSDSDGSPAERLIDAITDDIVEGRVPCGERLPAHRDLAYQLKIGLGSVSKAMAVLERRGLIKTVSGSGTFVAFVETRTGPSIDLSTNTPPRVLSDRMLAKTFSGISRRIKADLFSLYPPPGGNLEHRRLMAQWLSGLGNSCDANSLFLCNGAQQGLSIAFSLACAQGGTILTESMTYPGAIMLAQHFGFDLVPLEMDSEGITPDALDAALRMRARFQNPCVIYITPTMQNPTTATMGNDRRREVVKLARRYNALIVEDDVYSIEASAELKSILSLAPERTFYVNSLSKTLCPGLRIGVLIAPPIYVSATKAALAATSSTASSVSCAIMDEWLSDGTAATIRVAIEAESRRRLALARVILSDQVRVPAYSGFHVWLPMSRKNADKLGAAAGASGVLVTTSDVTAVNQDSSDGGVRLCLGAPTLADLKHALKIIAYAYHNLNS